MIRTDVLMRLCLLVLFLLTPLVSIASEPTFTIKEYVVDGEVPISDGHVQRVLGIFVGDDRKLSDLQSAARALEEAIKAEGFIFYRVVLPPQKLDSGIVRLNVLRFTVSKVEVSGNEFFSDENIKASLPHLKVGESLTFAKVQRSLQIANDHPAKRATIVMRQSREVPDAIEAEIKTRDAEPQQIFVSLNNTGTDDTGGERLSFGYQHSNLFDLDHAVTLSYTTSPGHWEDVEQKGAFYRIPLYGLGSSLTFSAIDSDVDSGQVGDFTVSGSGTFYGSRFQYALKKIDDYSQSIFVSLEDKEFENDVSFFGLPIGIDVRSRPLTIGYIGRMQTSRLDMSVVLSYSQNQNGGSNNDSLTYFLTRIGADDDWDATRFSVDASYTFENRWKIYTGLSGQDTKDALIPGEQFGLGGVYSIRGFEEREISGDRGWELRTELWMPPLDNGLQFFGFVDTGKIQLTEPVPGLANRESITSAGLGGEWKWKNLSSRFEWGHVLDDLSYKSDGDHKLHFSLFYRF